MQKLFYLLMLLILIVPMLGISQQQNASVRTSFVLQRWDVENVDDAIIEDTFPIEIVYSLRENLNLQINHFPAICKYGEAEMSGLSDTWLRAAYGFAGNNALVSLGIGVPTGKTELNNTELILARVLSEEPFKFQLPVFGQGFTMTAGAMYAMPINDELTVGGGLNFVYRNSYKFSTEQIEAYNPGEQIGANLGLDYKITENISSNIDLMYNYYTEDKIKDTQIYKSGPRFSTRLGLIYQAENSYYWMQAMYQTKAKNEIYSLLNNKLMPEPKNSNITLRELLIGGKYQFTDKFSLSVNGEVRSYVENEYIHGWADIAGGGIIGEYLLTETFSLFSGLKLLFGDIELAGVNPSVQGVEIQLGSQWNF